MKNLLKNKGGFTMVELMVVVIIVAILAAAAIPFYTANVKKAIRTEAVATLGAIRSAQRIYKAEIGGYSDDMGSLGVTIDDEQYFDAGSYSLSGVTTTTFTATCTSKTGNTAPGASKVLKHWANNVGVATIDQNGTINEL